jgi:hypothetical protein
MKEMDCNYNEKLIGSYTVKRAYDFFLDNFPVNTKTHFIWYKEYLSPDNLTTIISIIDSR